MMVPDKSQYIYTRARKYAISLISSAIAKGNFNMAVNTSLGLREVIDDFVRKSYTPTLNLKEWQLTIPVKYDDRSKMLYLEAYALAHRLKRQVIVTPHQVNGRSLLNAIVREHIYLPAMQYMFDSHMQIPKAWENLLISSDANILEADGRIKGVQFQITDVFSAEFYPIHLASSVNVNASSLFESAVHPRYLSQVYRYILKLQHSKISALMTQAFGGDTSTSYVLSDAHRFAPSDTVISLFVTVPMLKAGKILPRVNLLIRLEMLNGAEIRVVDKTVSTYPIIFTQASQYIPNVNYSSAVMSPTLLAYLLTQYSGGNVNE